MTDVTKAELDQVVAGETVPTRFLRTVDEHGDRVALRWRNPDESWGELTWAGYAEAVAKVAGGLRALGVERGDRVVLMMRNRPEFHVADLAALFCGATPISIYNSSAPEQVQYLTAHSGAKAAIVEDIAYLERFLKVRSELPALEHIAILEDPDGLAGDDVLPYAQLSNADPVVLRESATIARPEDLCTVIYTSGTTGPPKGVMLSHYNIVFTAEGYLHLLEGDTLGWRGVSYLPMAHIAERMTGHYLGIVGGLEVTTCPETSQLSTYLAHVRPQTFFGVPRVWEKMYSGVNAALAADEEKAKQFNEAVEAATRIDEVRRRGEALTPEQQQTWELLDQVAFKGVRELLGLDHCEIAVTGAAPIPVDVLEWFRAIGVPFSEVYGMSESSGPMTWEPYRVKVGTVGKACPGSEVKLLDDAEVVCRGGNVFEGYLNDPEKTRDALDEDGWLHSGDIGEFDDEGYLRIVDRKKELIITAGGKNISPANLEAALKSFPLIGQAAVIGDNRPFISALLVLDAEVAPAWAKQHGIGSATLAELATSPDVQAEVERNVREANARFSQVEQIKKWTLLGEEWLPDSEELT
ncbi:MAG: long-chain acyl-CoA synthetase, partial [Actinomycetota bacterium]|nr:long-chain acyl-CoA synthetase [Actinomycetota bacterium]